MRALDGPRQVTSWQWRPARSVHHHLAVAPGPIGIAQMAGNTAQAGFLPFMYLMALLSISLAVLNLLPIPVLDGGQLTLLGIEAIRGEPLPEKVENIIYSGGVIMVGMLMIFAIFNDISRFF